MTIWHTIVFVLVMLAAALIAICLPLQYRALNRTAFGRSVFVSGTSILMGLMVGFIPGIGATIISLFLILLGLGFILLLGVKSWQRLQMVKRAGK